ncbi:CCD17 protein, partial [Zapornia atra]|nr:CCD17 protein [Zapornia atra]
ALRLSYLRTGGPHPAILAQLLDLQLEATALETGAAGPHRGRRPGKPQPKPPSPTAKPPSAGTQGLDTVLLAVELENQQLEKELLARKVRRERRAGAGSRAAQQHAEELAQLQAEVGMLRCCMEQRGPQLPPAKLPPPVAPPLPP